MSDYRIALRPDDPAVPDGPLDDVVVRDVSMFRAEMMDKGSLWMCCYFPGSEERLDFWVQARGGKLVFTASIQPSGPEFTYES